eukprot:scaffold11547_cov108-Isochrysis_galbana.AAC.1
MASTGMSISGATNRVRAGPPMPALAPAGAATPEGRGRSTLTRALTRLPPKTSTKITLRVGGGGGFRRMGGGVEFLMLVLIASPLGRVAACRREPCPLAQSL